MFADCTCTPVGRTTNDRNGQLFSSKHVLHLYSTPQKVLHATGKALRGGVVPQAVKNIALACVNHHADSKDTKQGVLNVPRYMQLKNQERADVRRGCRASFGARHHYEAWTGSNARSRRTPRRDHERLLLLLLRLRLGSSLVLRDCQG